MTVTKDTSGSTSKDGKASGQYTDLQPKPYDDVLKSHKAILEQANKNGSIRIIEPGTDQHIAETDARQSIPREKRYAALEKYAKKHNDEINGVKFETLKTSIEALNASGRAVLCKVGGVNYLFQPKEQEKVAENQAAVAQAQQEEETSLGMKILKLTGILALIGLATFGLYKLFRKWNGDDEKTIVKYQNDPTSAPTPTTTINSLQPPTNVQTQTNSTTGNGVLGSGLGTPVTDATFPTVTNNALGSNSNSNGLG